MTRRLIFAFVLLALAAFPRAVGASTRLTPTAHAGLLSADPAPGSTVSSPVTEIRLTFNDYLAPGSTFSLSTGLFQTVPGVNPLVENDTLRAVLAAPLAEGAYTVQWTAVTEDGGATEGSYQFGVGGAARVPWWAWGVAIALIAALGVIVWGRRRARAPSN